MSRAISPNRAGDRLAQLCDREGLDRASIRIAAISQNAADACGGGWETIDIAASRDDASLLALAHRLCQTSDDA